MSGTLYLVGTGPGDPELLTLKSVRVLGAVDVIAFPQKSGEPSLSYRIAEAHLNPAAKRMPVEIPMAVERAPAQAAYDDFAQQLLAELKSGKNIAYLCEGDPLFYGSAMYLLARITGLAPVEIVPGITSLTATAAAIARPLAARNDVLKILPAPLGDDRLRAELLSAEAVAIIKVGRHFDRVRKLLEETGHAANAVIVERASDTNQKVTRLRDFNTDERPYFSTILCYKGAEEWSGALPAKVDAGFAVRQRDQKDTNHE